MLKKWIIRLLLKLLEPGWTYIDIEDDAIQNWLEQQGQYKGYVDYFRKRDLTHLKALGLGLDREQYLLRVGQRLELLHFLHQVEKATDAKKKEDDRRQKELDARQAAERRTN